MAKSVLDSAPLWKGRPVLKADHIADLETRAAAHEFGGKMKRGDAEQKAHDDYRKEQLTDAAAHHFVGLKASHAAGDGDAAKRHAVFYTLALKELGHDNPLEPPDEVKLRAEHTPAKVYKFRSHIGDVFSMPKA